MSRPLASSARFHQDFERGLGAEPGHTRSQTEIGQLIHDRGKNRRSSRRSLAIFLGVKQVEIASRVGYGVRHIPSDRRFRWRLIR